MFTYLSGERALNLKIMLDNMFIVEYMPQAKENYVKVYLYGLSLASHNLDKDNSLERMAKRLGLEEGEVMEAFRYWEELNIVRVHSGSPLSVEYLPVRSPLSAVKKFSKEKYKGFNDQLTAMLPGRNILPNEYNEYYTAMETLRIEPEAMLVIIAYCIRLKGGEIGYQYILTVARNLAGDGCTTYDRVSERLSEYDHYDKDLAAILKALGKKRKPDHEDLRLFIKWTKSMGFTAETILHAAKLMKKSGDMPHLDQRVQKYYELQLSSPAQIDEYLKKRDELIALARSINRIIGVYYEQVDFIIETYISKWIDLGFSDDTLLLAADYCFRRSIRTLEGMDGVIGKFYKQGLVSADSINSYIDENASRDTRIKELLEAAGSSRPVVTRDRECYRTWKKSWNMPDDVIDHAAALSAGKSNPVSYMNSILASWHDKKLTTLDAVKSDSRPLPEVDAGADKDKTVKKHYTSEQLNAMFDNLDAEDL